MVRPEPRALLYMCEHDTICPFGAILWYFLRRSGQSPLTVHVVFMGCDFEGHFEARLGPLLQNQPEQLLNKGTPIKTKTGFIIELGRTTCRTGGQKDKQIGPYSQTTSTMGPLSRDRDTGN